MKSQIIEKNKNGIQVTEEEFQAAYNKYLLWFQDELLKQPQIETPTFHDFAPGIYIRTMCAQEGSIVIGKMHKTEHFNVCLAGSALVMINGELKLVKAPAMFVSKAKTKKIFKILEDLVYFTIHPSNETDTDKLEEELTYTLEEEREIISGGEKCLLQ
jgi:hypothetical protein